MGMFDTVYVDPTIPLPNRPAWAAAPRADYQTKDLDCALDVYAIGPDRRLRRTLRGWADADEERSPDNTPMPHSGMLSIHGCADDGSYWYRVELLLIAGLVVAAHDPVDDVWVRFESIDALLPRSP